MPPYSNKRWLSARSELARSIARIYGTSKSIPLNLGLMLLRLQRYLDKDLAMRFEAVLCRKLGIVLRSATTSVFASVLRELELLYNAAQTDTSQELLDKCRSASIRPATKKRKCAEMPRPKPHSRDLVDRAVRLSQSALWNTSMKYYAQRGLAAWSANDVPCGISSNGFLAEAYAKIVAAHLSCISQPGDGEVFTVVELGSGHCRLGFLLAVTLQELLPEKKIRVVMTDFNRELVEQRMTHPAFATMLRCGVVDFAVFDAGAPEDEVLYLLGSGERLARCDVVVANYTLDSLPCDLFRRGDSETCVELQEGLVTSQRCRRGDRIDLESLSFKFRGIGAATNYYESNAESVALVRAAKTRSPGELFLFPAVALRAVRRLKALRGEDVAVSSPMLVLVGDKAFSSRDANTFGTFAAIDAGAVNVPLLDRHGDGGCISVGIDLTFFSQCLGWADSERITALPTLQTLQYDQSFSVLATRLDRPPLSERNRRRDRVEFPPTVAKAFDEVLCIFGPSDFERLTGFIEEQTFVVRGLSSEALMTLHV